jgi:hypothetical protein
VLQTGADSFKVVMCAVNTVWGDEGEWKGLQKCTDSCDMVMCAVVTGWGRRREMERVRESY